MPLEAVVQFDKSELAVRILVYRLHDISTLRVTEIKADGGSGLKV